MKKPILLPVLIVIIFSLSAVFALSGIAQTDQSQESSSIPEPAGIAVTTHAISIPSPAPANPETVFLSLLSPTQLAEIEERRNADAALLFLEAAQNVQLSGNQPPVQGSKSLPDLELPLQSPAGDEGLWEP